MNLCGRTEFESKGQGEGQKGDRVFPTNGVSLTLPALTEAKVWALKRVAARLAPRTVPKSPGGWEAPRRSLRCPVRGRGEAGLRLLRLVKQPKQQSFLPGPLPRRQGGGSEGARARPCSPARPGLPPAPPGTNEDTNMFCTGTAHMQTLMPSPPWRSERLMKPRGHVTGQHGQPRLCVYSAAHWATRAGRINTGNRARSNPEPSSRPQRWHRSDWRCHTELPLAIPKKSLKVQGKTAHSCVDLEVPFLNTSVDRRSLPMRALRMKERPLSSKRGLRAPAPCARRPSPANGGPPALTHSHCRRARRHQEELSSGSLSVRDTTALTG